MTEEERTTIMAILDRRKLEGNPEEVKREYVRSLFSLEISDIQLRRAEKYRARTIKAWSQERWLDMGLATVVFTVHTDRQGRLVADV
jgi:hypothetical protein